MLRKKSTQTTIAQTSFAQAVFNVVNIMLGIGLLSLPFALRQSGWIGLFFLWMMAVVCNVTGKKLVQCADTVEESLGLGHRPCYEDVAMAAFGKYVSIVMSLIMYLEYSVACSMLFILQGDNLHSLVGGMMDLSASRCMLISAVIIIPTVWLPNLKSLSYLGLIGFCATAAVVTIVAGTIVTGNNRLNTCSELGPLETTSMAFGVMAYCYNGHGVFLSIQASMKEPEQFPKVLNTAITLVACLCTVIAASGYYVFGCESADVIIFNLRGGMHVITSAIVLINPFAMFAVTMEPMASAACRLSDWLFGYSPRMLLRTLLALFLLAAAYSLPYLVHIMSLLGSFMTMCVCVIFPTLCHLALCNRQVSLFEVAMDCTIVCFGVYCSFLGTNASYQSLVLKATSEWSHS